MEITLPPAFNHSRATSQPDITTHPAIKVVFALVSCWIIFAHGTIVVCFVVNRSKPWTNYSKQILSLSLNDLSVGIGSLGILIVTNITFKIPYAICTASFCFFFAAICSNLYHVLAICVHRFVMMIKKPTAAEPKSIRFTVILVMLGWIPACCIFFILFGVWAGEENSNIRVCIVDRIFGDHMYAAYGFIACGFIIPIVCTNLLYVTTFLKLRSMWRKISPMSTNSKSTTTGETVVNTATNGTRPGIRAQRNANFTIGLLLLCFNLFTIPFLVLFFVLCSGTVVDQSLKSLAANVFIMNSATSPFVYAIRTKCLGQALKDLAKCRLSWFRGLERN